MNLLDSNGVLVLDAEAPGGEAEVHVLQAVVLAQLQHRLKRLSRRSEQMFPSVS